MGEDRGRGVAPPDPSEIAVPGAGPDLVTPVFILSLPRTGSTLLQRLLATHAEVATAGEPWLLLPLVYALRKRGVIAEYDHVAQVSAVTQFVEQLPNGVIDYLEEVTGLASRLYTKASPPGTRFFVEKSPPYYFILDELFSLFPNAKFVYLWRNPLAVAASMAEMWGEGMRLGGAAGSSDRWSFNRWRLGLEVGLENLVASYEENEARSIAIRYEDLVARPAEVVAGVFDYCGLSAREADVGRYSDVEIRGKGDPKRDAFDGDITVGRVDAWAESYRSPLRRYWGRNYLHRIGDRRLALMGYRRSELIESMELHPRSLEGTARDAVEMSLDAARLAVELKYWDVHSRRRFYKRIRAPLSSIKHLAQRGG